MSYIGIDLSLASTGLARWDDGDWATATITTLPAASPEAYLDRVETIAGRILSWADPREGDVIAIEGPALHARSSNLDRMFGAWWLVARAIRDHHGMPHVVPPTVVKKLATGKGTSGKDEVLLATARRLTGCPVSNADESDAAWVAVAASILDGHPVVDLPATHTKGII